ncbi:hypothetical protein KTAU_04260 [Thermogemmatispora aurantia]|uniref:Uncharacterized protein n=1 Tax=Thermogemmatispora aurantia TaxID=2045279 RepID=A0A5J4JW45_9CHLR|nr:hypothetical protein KTAU_04260 [Thermogemmatispora aurantia]
MSSGEKLRAEEGRKERLRACPEVGFRSFRIFPAIDSPAISRLLALQAGHPSLTSQVLEALAAVSKAQG